MENMINYLLDNSQSKKIAIVTHNACTLFYILKYCTLLKAQTPKKLTIAYNNKIIIDNSIMKSPSIIKLTFNNKVLKKIKYIV